MIVPIYDARRSNFDINNYAELPSFNSELDADSCCVAIFTVHTYKPSKSYMLTYDTTNTILSFNLLAVLLIANKDEFGSGTVDFNRDIESVGVTYD